MGIASYEIEEYLNEIADQMDGLMLEQGQAQMRLAKALTKLEEADARKLLGRNDLL